MNEAHVNDLLSAYIDGDLTAEQRRQVEAHLVHCKTCAQELEALRETIRLIRAVPIEDPPPTLYSSVMAAIPRQQQPPQRLAPRRWFKPVAIAASVAVVLMGAGWILSLLPVFLGGMGSSSPPMTAVELDSSAGGGSGGAATFSGEVTSSVAPYGAPAVAERVQAEIDLPSRKLVRRGYARVEVRDVKEGYQAIVQLVDVRGGYIEESSLFVDRVRGDGGLESSPGRASLVARVPSGELEGFFEDLEQVGTVRHANITSDDITENYVDTESRLRNLTAQELRYLDILEQADNVDEVLRVENELWRLRGEIETLQGRLQNWDRMVEMATANVDLQPADRLDIGLGSRLIRAWRDSLDAAVSGIEYMIVGAGALLPWAILATIVWLVYRRWSLGARQGRGI